MKRKFLYVVLSTLLCILSAPSADAYLSTNKQAFTVDDKIGIFIIDFNFGHENHEIHIPVATQTGTNKHEDKLSYMVWNDERERALGTSVGIVLSNMKVRDGMYVIPKGIQGSFRLLVLFDPSDDDIGEKYNAGVTNLPFSFDSEEQLSLNPSELNHYATPELVLE